MTEEGKKVIRILDEKKISYECMEHEPVYTVEEIQEKDLWHHEDGIGAKNLFLRDGSGKRHFLVVIRDDKQADLKEVRSEIGSSRLSFASQERLKKYLGVSAGSVSPLGILNDTECAVEVFFDRDLKEYSYIAVHPNDNSATVWMKTEDLVEMIREHGNSFEWIRI
nr:prolyl-tRNA synthetase associated domain-containing protein [uncultured Anaerostipes sp.]